MATNDDLRTAHSTWIITCMSASMIPVVTALIAAITALVIALQNRRWITADRQDDRLAKEQARQLEAGLATQREAANRMFDLSPSVCPELRQFQLLPAGARRETPAQGFDAAFLDALSQSVQGSFAQVEPLRRQAVLLPMYWRLRIDCLLSMYAHWGAPKWRRQLELDLADLLNGRSAPRQLGSENLGSYLTWLFMILSTNRYSEDPSTRHLEGAVWELTASAGNSEVWALLTQVTGASRADLCATPLLAAQSRSERAFAVLTAGDGIVPAPVGA